MYCFKGDPDYVQIMTGSSVELCNLANNHSLDFGKAGLRRTAELLEQAGIGCCGYTKVYSGTIKGVAQFAGEVGKVVNDYMTTLTDDVSWFCKKFDYRYDAEPWYNSKDAVERAIKFIRSDIHNK